MTAENARKLSGLVARFTRDLVRQRRRDGDVLASLMRAILDPKNGEQAARLRKILGGSNG
jgi:hypothetical protein